SAGRGARAPGRDRRLARARFDGHPFARPMGHRPRPSRRHAETQRGVPVSAPESEGGQAAYRGLLAQVEEWCRRTIAAAEGEAADIRNQVRDERRRLLGDAQRERAAILVAARSEHVAILREAEAEIERWLDELDEERADVLSAARAHAERLVAD